MEHEQFLWCGWLSVLDCRAGERCEGRWSRGGPVRSSWKDADRACKSVIVEAERRLEELKAEFLTDTGKEWSDMRAEGPVLLTTNEVRGSEVRPELKLKLKQLTRGNVLR